jgi:hypothetical protein
MFFIVFGVPPSGGNVELRWLERALQERDPVLSSIRFFAMYDFVRGDPRFQAVLQKTGH